MRTLLPIADSPGSFAVALLLLSFGITSFAQTQHKAAKMPAFDVASIRLNQSVGMGFSMDALHGRLTATNVTVRALIGKGFHVNDSLVFGGPEWLDTSRYDVIAKTDDTAIGDDELWLLLQPLLLERFQLRLHRDTKELPVYSLVIAKNGPKLTASTRTGNDNMVLSFNSGGASAYVTKTSMAKFAESLGHFTDRTVINHTGLKGDFDFKLEWSPEHHGESILGALQQEFGLSPPSIFIALQEQLGLKLEAARGPVETIVIEGVERPSAN